MAVAVWAGQTASSVAETEKRRIAVSKDGVKRAVATGPECRKALKAAGAPGGLELAIHRISLIQILVI